MKSKLIIFIFFFFLFLFSLIFISSLKIQRSFLLIPDAHNGENGWWILFNKFSFKDSNIKEKINWFWKIISFQRINSLQEHLELKIFWWESKNSYNNYLFFQLTTFYIFIIFPIFVLTYLLLFLKRFFRRKRK